MTKEQKHRLKQDPQKYQDFLDARAKYRRQRLKRIKSDPVLYKKHRKKQKLLYAKLKEERRKIREQRRANSPYWKIEGWLRYKCRIFKRYANVANNRCKTGRKITALDLFGIAKKQRLICPLTGKKLTRDSISLDHIKPITNGGTNSLDNLRFITRQANVAKHEMSDADFLSFCKDIVNHHVLERGHNCGPPED